ncbi:MAG: PepSY domain-containing protein [Gammaproteobacteria bacterium]
MKILVIRYSSALMLVLPVLAVMAMPAPAFSGTPEDGLIMLADLDMEQARKLKQAGSIMPLEDLLKAVRREYPGQVIEVELEEADGRFYYEIEVLADDGIVRELDVDATTGEILDVEIEDD